MVEKLNTSAAVAEAERIMGLDTKGFAWAPEVSISNIRRYGLQRGLIQPLTTNGNVRLKPPIINDAPLAGREDWRAISQTRRLT